MKNLITTLFLALFTLTVGAQESLISATGGPNPQAESPFSDANCSIDGALVVEQDPNQSNGLFSDTDCSFCGTGSQLMVQPINVAADVTINQACWVGGFFPACTPAAFPDFQISFHSDNAGLPGPAFAGPFTVTADNVDTGTDLFGTDEIASSATFDNVDLVGGSRVYVLISTTSATGCNYFWEVAGSGEEALFSSDLGATWNPLLDGTSLSLFLGEAPEDVEVVPTMGEWGVISLGLMMVIFAVVAIRQRKTAIA